MIELRAALLAASMAAAGCAGVAFAATDRANIQPVVLDQEPSPALRVTSPPGADPARTYEEPKQALLEADLDYLVREAHRAIARGDNESIWPVLLFADDVASGRNGEARAVLEAAPGGLRGGIADILEPFLLAAEGHVDRGVERVDQGGDDLPAPLPDVARALLFESAGRLNEAAAIYSQMEEGLDLTPPPQREPANLEEFQRSLGAGRITHAMYRAALVQHRLGHAAEARRLYAVVTQFAPRSADVERNLARLEAGEQPLEPALDARRATGRWLLFVSEFLTQSESISRAMADADPEPGLSSASGALFLQLGIVLDPDASDWRLYAANELVDAGGLDGAERVIAQMPADSVFAADAEIVRAAIALERKDDAGAVAAAERALATGAERWSVIASAGDIYRSVGRAPEAISAFDRALTMVETPKDRADILGWRAYAHRYSGDVSAASADMRQALELDPSDDTKMLYVSILMDDPRGWRDGIRVAREMFAAQPDSVLRLNALGYALIQRPEGLEEGYRLLWRGFNYGQSDYAVVDSLGWAYYQYGAFDQARALIERARDLSEADPNAEILDHLGDVYWRLNRREEARATWQVALESRPDALRRRDLTQKLASGLTSPAPQQRPLPQVSLPTGPAERGDL
jgi:tetratricopeptide (TPR) repeat protein